MVALKQIEEKIMKNIYDDLYYHPESLLNPQLLNEPTLNPEERKRKMNIAKKFLLLSNLDIPISLARISEDCENKPRCARS